MSGRNLVRIAIVLMLSTPILAAMTATARAGPGEAGRGRRATPAPPEGLANADYVVLIWFRSDDALGTFQYQIYDARKGEYGAAVTAWTARVRAEYPRYEVHERPVVLARETGTTEKLRVGAVIHRELLLAAARSGVVIGAPIRIGAGPSATPRTLPRPDFRPEIPGAGAPADINPVGRTSPFPVPYPRPHP